MRAVVGPWLLCMLLASGAVLRPARAARVLQQPAAAASSQSSLDGATSDAPASHVGAAGGSEQLLARLAASTGLSPQALQQRLAAQGMHLDAASGEVIAEDLAVQASARDWADAAGLVDASLTPEAVFSLSSRPGSKFKIVLDFSGHTLTDSPWNKRRRPDGSLQPVLVTPPYDRDGQPGAWSAQELSDIKAVWEGVAEDYAPFDVDVTTAEPASDDELAGVGVRVIIGGSSSDWFGVAGGVAMMSSFGDPSKPVFVFARNLGPNYARYIWEEASHEVGHALGLLHDGLLPRDGRPATPYFGGHGAWGSIMGSSYHRAVTQFDRGEYSHADNQQDDFAVIQRFLPLAEAAHASRDTAAPLAMAEGPGGVSHGSGRGLVVAPGTPVVFSFEAAGGEVLLSARAAQPWGRHNRANLDIQLALLDAAGAQLASLNPPGMDALSGPLALPATPGVATYFVAVSGAGEGDPASTGYSDFGSRGRFSLELTLLPPGVDPGAALAAAAKERGAVARPWRPPQLGDGDLQVTSINMGRVWADRSTRDSYRCSATIRVSRMGEVSEPVPGAQVELAWASQPAGAAGSAALPVTATTMPGGVVLVRSEPVPAAAGNGCEVAVRSVSLPGSTGLNTAESVSLRKSLTW